MLYYAQEGRVLKRANSINEADQLFRRRSLSSTSSNMGSPFVVTEPYGRTSNKSESSNSSVGEEAEAEGQECYSDRHQLFGCSGGAARRFSSIGMRSASLDEEIIFPKQMAWDWPFTDEGIARGVYLEDRFLMYLPSNGNRSVVRKFSKIEECDFSWTIGLNNCGGGTGFWTFELEICRNLNTIIIVVCRDISRSDSRSAKRLKRVKKVYRLPQLYDVSTLTSTIYDWAIVIEVARRRDVRTNRPPLFN